MKTKDAKKRAQTLLKLRKVQAQVAGAKKANSMRQQKEAFREWRQAQKTAQDYENARNEEANAAMQNMCSQEFVKRTELEHEYASFSWETDRLKELQQVTVEKADTHKKRVEVTEQARTEHIYRENKSDQAARFSAKAVKDHNQFLLATEAEESEEIATARHIYAAQIKS